MCNRMRKNDSLKAEWGFTLIELIVAIVIIGVALPAIFSLYASLSAKASDGAVLDQMAALAQNKMEEIIAKKEADWAWYQDPTQFEADERLADDYHRTVTVNTISNWGNAALNGWEVTVTVSNTRISNDYTLQVRLTKYYLE